MLTDQKLNSIKKKQLKQSPFSKPYFSFSHPSLPSTVAAPCSAHAARRSPLAARYYNCRYFSDSLTHRPPSFFEFLLFNTLGEDLAAMLRRNIRLRREYLYRKSLEGKERLLYEKKRKIREALEEGKPFPTELRNEEAALRKEIELEDDLTAVPRTHIDDEYANASQIDPKILITTSRDPSAPLTQFAKELKIVFPNAQRMNRGGQVIAEIIETCRAHEFTDVILVHEHRGVPDGLIISHLPFGPTAYFGLLNVVTRHEIKDKKAMGTMPEAYPHIILNNFTTKLGERTANVLKHLFPVPKPDTKRVVTFANQSDYISFRHHIYEKHGGAKSIELKEIGPRFELRLYQIKLGTVDQTEAQNEWVIRPYMKTTKKRQFLGD